MFEVGVNMGLYGLYNGPYPMTKNAEKEIMDIEVSDGKMTEGLLKGANPKNVFEFVKDLIIEYIGEAEHNSDLTQEQADIMVDFAVYLACVVNDMRD